MEQIGLFALKTAIVVAILSVGAIAVLSLGEAADTESSEGASAFVDDRAGLHPGLISDDTATLFDQSQVRTYSFTVDPADLAFLDADPALEQYVPATLRVDGLAVGDVGLRYKGSVGAFIGCLSNDDWINPSGSKTCTKLSMKAKINWDGNGQEFYGVRRLQFHSQNLDPTHLHERLGYWMFAEMGVVTAQSVHARVEVNDEFVGLFALTENIDGRFVRDRFDDGSGNLYKGVWPLSGTGEVRDEERLLGALRTNEDADDQSAAMIQAFANDVIVDEATAAATIEQWTDLDAFLSYFLVDRTIRHDDGPLHWYCMDDSGVCSTGGNFYWYEEPDAGRVHLIPWDLDNAFENLGEDINTFTWIADDFGETRNNCERFLAFAEGWPQRSAACDPIVAAAASFDADLARLDAALTTGPLAEIDQKITEWTEQIRPIVAQAAQAHDDAISVEDWQAAVEQLRLDLDLAPAES